MKIRSNECAPTVSCAVQSSMMGKCICVTETQCIKMGVQANMKKKLVNLRIIQKLKSRGIK